MSASLIITTILTFIAIFLSYRANELSGVRKLKSEKIKLYEEYAKYKKRGKISNNDTESENLVLEEVFRIITKRKENALVIDYFMKTKKRDELLNNLDGGHEFYTCDEGGQVTIDKTSTNKIRREFAYSTLLIALSILALTIITLLLSDYRLENHKGYIEKLYIGLNPNVKLITITVAAMISFKLLYTSLGWIFSSARSLTAINIIKEEQSNNVEIPCWKKLANGASKHIKNNIMLVVIPLTILLTFWLMDDSYTNWVTSLSN